MRHPRRWVERRQGYWRLRSFIAKRLKQLVPVPVKQRAKRVIEWSRDRVYIADVRRVQGANDSYASLTLLPKLSKAECAALPNRHGAGDQERRADIICFSIIEWTFRYQRPQQLMSQFASRGHRVFYINPTRVQSGRGKPAFSVRQIKENLYELTLPSQHARDIFAQGIVGKDLELTLSGLDELRRSHDVDEAIGYVMISSWTAVALEARRRWGWLLVYDCMDEWENFPLIRGPLLEMESRLVESCDLLVATAKRLIDKWRPYGRPAVLVRNAVDYQFYEEHCRLNDRLANVKHPVVGYFGAIAEWFDVALVTAAARQRPEYSFVLIGGDFDVDISELRTLPNVQLLGQRPYETMPEYLYHFDVCIIPFKLNSITQATDPVKLYEYLSAGKPVVATHLHEVETYSEHVYLANDAEDFVAKLDAALAEDDPALVANRRELARQNTWETRCQQILEGLVNVVPRASIIIVTYNNLLLTRLCLESVIRNTQYLNYEVIIVDNDSRDGTPDYLRALAHEHSHVSVILNQDNLGFAKANNQGIARATGEYLVLLNNDTIVPPGWLSRLLWHLLDPAVGLVGPVTNAIGNEARIEVAYRTWGEMESFAHVQTWAHEREVADIHMLAMYCVGMRRETYDEIGPLDERFGVGMFEDDDYSMRVRGKCYRVICAADVYVHHFGQAAFGKLIRSGEYDSIFEENRRRFETKWGITWKAHRNAPLKLALHELASERERLLDTPNGSK
jgi:GT2 family glycosyltransferase/glycosyltransferase involved in cell wall biosynthesis